MGLTRTRHVLGPRPRVIPYALHTEVCSRLRSINPDTQRHYTAREVAAWLAREHGVRVHYTTVARLYAAIEKHTEERLVAAIRGELRDAVEPTRRKLARALAHLDSLVKSSEDPKAVATAVSAITRALHELATLGGIAVPVAVDLTTHGRPITLSWAEDHAPAATPRSE